MGGGGGEQVGTMSNPTKLLLSCFELSSVTLGFDNTCSMMFIGFRKFIFLRKCKHSLAESRKSQGPFRGLCKAH